MKEEGRGEKILQITSRVETRDEGGSGTLVRSDFPCRCRGTRAFCLVTTPLFRHGKSPSFSDRSSPSALCTTRQKIPFDEPRPGGFTLSRTFSCRRISNCRSSTRTCSSFSMCACTRARERYRRYELIISDFFVCERSLENEISSFGAM